MAAAIAESRLAEHPGRPEILSAGLSAGEGQPSTPEGVRSLRNVGIEAAPHASRQLTAEMLERADLVFGLTHDHVDAMLDAAPAFSDKILLLDPDGESIADPFGGTPADYDHTRDLLIRAIDRRLPLMVGIGGAGTRP